LIHKRQISSEMFTTIRDKYRMYWISDAPYHSTYSIINVDSGRSVLACTVISEDIMKPTPRPSRNFQNQIILNVDLEKVGFPDIDEPFKIG
jgi:hypothetical protein